jgi:phage recombination protein Bet
MSTALTKLTENLAASFDLDASNSKELMDTLKATAFKVKNGVVSDAQMTALMIVAQQYGLNPWVKEIYAFPDQQNGIVPVVGVDGWIRIINQHPQFNGVEFKYADEFETPKGGKLCPIYIDCIIYRKDREKPVVVREYLDEVYREAQYKSPWQTHTKRFLRHKALIQCARVAFGFSGIYEQDEAENIAPTEKIINPAPEDMPLSAQQVLEKIKTNPDENFNWIDSKAYDKDEKAQFRAACAARRKELAEAAVVSTQTQTAVVEEAPAPEAKAETSQTPNWPHEIMEAGSTADLKAVEAAMSDAEKKQYADALADQYDFLRGM